MIHETSDERFGNALKSPKCVQCGKKYHYFMQAMGIGYGATYFFIGLGRAHRNAAKEAEQELQKKLKTGCAPVPCPDCGAYQPKMIDLVQRKHLAFLRKTGKFLIVIGFAVIVFAGISLINKGVWGAGLFPGLAITLSGIALWVIKEVASKTLDPNSAPVEERIALAKKLGVDPSRLVEAQVKADKETAKREKAWQKKFFNWDD